MPTLITASDAQTRLDHALAWLDERKTHTTDTTLIVGPTIGAIDDLVRAHVRARGATCGIERTTLDRIAARLAAPGLAARGLAPAGRLALQAMVTRSVFLLNEAGELRCFGPVADLPGLPVAVAKTLWEIRMTGMSVYDLAGLGEAADDLARIATHCAQALTEAGLADRSLVYEAAIEAAEATPVGALLLLDLRLRSRLEQALVRALVHRSPCVLALAVSGDDVTLASLREAMDAEPQHLAPVGGTALDRLKRNLFSSVTPPPASADATFEVASWPGEARECVEIARAVMREAAQGTPFDVMAVVLRTPEVYRGVLEEAFTRAGIPFCSAGGVRRPHPSGRALLALLACALDRLSASRFAEYLSLSQVPDRPPTDAESASAWTPPRDALSPCDVSAWGEEARSAHDVRALVPDRAGVRDGALRAPWRWERLIVDAAVIGGADRWARRLQGLRAQLTAQRARLDAVDEARLAALDHRLTDLAHLEAFALPLVARLAALPPRATWDVWLPALQALAEQALREPQHVLEVLAELAPLGPVGPVTLEEVRAVLDERLRTTAVAPPRRRHGCVYVASIDGVRGMAFDVVFVPGLVEKGFPPPLSEDPVLLDETRFALRTAGHLETQRDRAAEERLLLRLAIGAARRRLCLSYPRVDAETGRPRIPSFYVLESLRAGEGARIGFEALRTTLAERAGPSRLGWPAPAREGDAIDAAEYDLARIARMLGDAPEAARGTSAYLMQANPHLARALRARWRRAQPRWTRADGLDLRDRGRPRDEERAVDILARAALADHQMSARAYSARALQQYAACPYRFFLHAIQRLAPRDAVEAPERLDPLTRGALFQQAQRLVLSRLQARGDLPVTTAQLEGAIATVDAALAEVEAAARERLAPPIARVWDDDITALRADLREWMRRAAADDGAWVPHGFALAFGPATVDTLPDDSKGDSATVRLFDRLQLRGVIDLVERAPDGRLRVTDHRTGACDLRSPFVVKGGEVLQPLLHALACEKVVPDLPVESGRLYFCTTAGGYEDRGVVLTERARVIGRKVVQAIDEALAEGVFPASPTETACQSCDYRTVCAPHERERARRKQESLVALQALREVP